MTIQTGGCYRQLKDVNNQFNTVVDDSLNSSTLCTRYTTDPKSLLSCINLQTLKEAAITDS